MEDEDKAALEASLDYICSNLQLLGQILGILRTQSIITKGNEDEIMKEETPYERNKTLIDSLLKKKGAYKPLIEALCKTGQAHIVETVRKNHSQYASGSSMDTSPPPTLAKVTSGTINKVEGTGVVIGSSTGPVYTHTGVGHQYNYFNNSPLAVARNKKASETLLSLVDKETLNRNHATLINNMKCIPVCDELVSLRSLTQSDFEDIQAERTNSDQNRKLLAVIRKGRDDGLTNLIHALRNTEQYHLANCLENSI